MYYKMHNIYIKIYSLKVLNWVLKILYPCNHHHHNWYRTFLYPSKLPVPTSDSQPQADTDLLSRIPHKKWNCTTCTRLCLAYFAQHNVAIHPYCRMNSSFFLWLINIPFNDNITTGPFTYRWTFDCFQFLTIMNKVAMNICVQVFVQANVFVFLG